MEYPIPNPSGNKMLSLVNELYQRSTGMCRAGAGPYGIGVSVVSCVDFLGLSTGTGLLIRMPHSTAYWNAVPSSR